MKNPLGDDRFASMFTNRDFEIDQESEQYKLLHPVISKHEKDRQKHDSDDGSDVYHDSGSDEDMEMWEEVRAARKELNNKEKANKAKSKSDDGNNKVKMYSLKDDYELTNLKKASKNVALGELLEQDTGRNIVQESGTALGSREITFTLEKSKRDKSKEEALKAHKIERKKVRRPTGKLLGQGKKKAVFWRGKRVK